MTYRDSGPFAVLSSPFDAVLLRKAPFQVLFVVCRSSFYLTLTFYARDCAPAHSDSTRNGTLSVPFTASFSLLTFCSAHCALARGIYFCSQHVSPGSIFRSAYNKAAVALLASIRPSEYTTSVIPAGTGRLAQIESLGPLQNRFMDEIAFTDTPDSPWKRRQIVSRGEAGEGRTSQHVSSRALKA
jgi:hypothetical protein